MRLSLRWFLLVPVFLLTACTQAPAPPAATTEADEAALRQGEDAWIAFFNAADADGLGGTYDAEVVQMRPEGPPLVGPAAIVEDHRNYFNEFTAVQVSNIDELAVFGDLAMSRGTWTTRQTPKAGGDEQVRTGSWMVVHKRQADGSWKVWRWIWNQQPVESEGGN